MYFMFYLMLEESVLYHEVSIGLFLKINLNIRQEIDNKKFVLYSNTVEEILTS